MRQSDCLHVLNATRRDVFLRRDLVRLLGRDNPKSAGKTIDRLVKAGVLIQACRSVYVYALADRASLPDVPAIYRVANALRRGDYVFESLESAAAQYGLISQVPLGRLTLMTTGRRGVFATTLGTIEFVHTTASPATIADMTRNRPGNPIPIATPVYTIRCLRRCGRSLDLLEEMRGDDR